MLPSGQEKACLICNITLHHTAHIIHVLPCEYSLRHSLQPIYNLLIPLFQLILQLLSILSFQSTAQVSTFRIFLSSPWRSHRHYTTAHNTRSKSRVTPRITNIRSLLTYRWQQRNAYSSAIYATHGFVREEGGTGGSRIGKTIYYYPTPSISSFHFPSHPQSYHGR